MSDIVRVHDGPDPSRGIPVTLRAGQEQVFGHQEMPHREAQLLDHRTPPRPEILDSRAEHVVRGGEEGLRVDVEDEAAPRAEPKAIEGRSQAMNVEEEPQEPEAETEA